MLQISSHRIWAQYRQHKQESFGIQNRCLTGKNWELLFVKLLFPFALTRISYRSGHSWWLVVLASGGLPTPALAAELWAVRSGQEPGLAVGPCPGQFHFHYPADRGHHLPPPLLVPREQAPQTLPAAGPPRLSPALPAGFRSRDHRVPVPPPRHWFQNRSSSFLETWTVRSHT